MLGIDMFVAFSGLIGMLSNMFISIVTHLRIARVRLKMFLSNMCNPRNIKALEDSF